MKLGKTSLVKWFLNKVVWILFSIVFFYSGLFFTEWLLNVETFAGGWRWLMVAVFPFLIPTMFIVSRRYGCASGVCNKEDADKDSLSTHFPLA